MRPDLMRFKLLAVGGTVYIGLKSLATGVFGRFEGGFHPGTKYIQYVMSSVSY